MICALLIGRDGSSGFPGKNIYPVIGRPLAYYPMRIALSCNSIDRLYVSTDSNELKDLALKCGATVINRPPELATNKATGEDAFVHGAEEIEKILNTEGKEIEFFVLLFANAVTFTPAKIEEGIKILRDNHKYDSAVSVSCYNMWSPLRARKINDKGLLEPFIPFDNFQNKESLTCDRDSQGDVWFADMGFSIVRPHCLKNIYNGMLPQKWMGNCIYPIKQWGGLDVDEPWQIPIVESWLESHEINKLFRFKRLNWNQLYESERTLLSKITIGSNSKVLDIGHEPGALSVILKEQYGITDYTAIESDSDNVREALVINPNAKIVNNSVTEYLNLNRNNELYNIIFGLHIHDHYDYLDIIMSEAYTLLKPGGYYVGTCRLTDKSTIKDITVSNQLVGAGGNTANEKVGFAHKDKVPYIINNVNDLLRSIRRCNPSETIIYGYSGRPSSTANTPLNILTFTVFAIRKPSVNNKENINLIELPQNIKNNISCTSESKNKLPYGLSDTLVDICSK